MPLIIVYAPNANMKGVQAKLKTNKSNTYAQRQTLDTEKEKFTLAEVNSQQRYDKLQSKQRLMQRDKSENKVS